MSEDKKVYVIGANSELVSCTVAKLLLKMKKGEVVELHHDSDEAKAIIKENAWPFNIDHEISIEERKIYIHGLDDAKPKKRWKKRQSGSKYHH